MKSPLTSDIMSKEIPEISFHTFPDSHGHDCEFDGILEFFSTFTVLNSECRLNISALDSTRSRLMQHVHVWFGAFALGG